MTLNNGDKEISKIVVLKPPRNVFNKLILQKAFAYGMLELR